jgi:predicted aspartyl protease
MKNTLIPRLAMRVALFYFTFAGLCQSVRAQSGMKTDASSTANHGPADGIPVELTSRFGLILVRLEVNGRPATLVVDTGSSHTILSTQLVQSRALTMGDDPSPRKGSGLVGRAAWIKATVKVGGTVWRDHEFLAMDNLSDISNAVGQKVDGFLGEDLLKDFSVVQIDFKHQRLVLLQ